MRTIEELTAFPKKSQNYKESNMEDIQRFLTELSKNLDLLSSLMPNVVDTEVKTFGNSGHIVLPKEYVGRKAKVIIKK